MDRLALKAELLNDPLGRGYAGLTDQQAADSLNAKDRTRNRTSVSPEEVLGAIQPAHVAALLANPADAQYIGWVLSLPEVPLNNAAINTVVRNIFTGKTSTLNALSALETEAVSRGQEIGWATVGAGDVHEARST